MSYHMFKLNMLHSTLDLTNLICDQCTKLKMIYIFNVFIEGHALHFIILIKMFLLPLLKMLGFTFYLRKHMFFHWFLKNNCVDKLI
jgi:hypothetical protein